MARGEEGETEAEKQAAWWPGDAVRVRESASGPKAWSRGLTGELLRHVTHRPGWWTIRLASRGVLVEADVAAEHLEMVSRREFTARDVALAVRARRTTGEGEEEPLRHASSASKARHRTSCSRRRRSLEVGPQLRERLSADVLPSCLTALVRRGSAEGGVCGVDLELAEGGVREVGVRR